MTRRQQLENIIIGTLLESNEELNYFDDCRMLTPDLFIDEANRRLFVLISKMNASGDQCTDPCSIFQKHFEDVSDIYLRMVDLCTEYSFIHLMTQHNERQFLASCTTGIEYRASDVQFKDYVDQFLRIVFYETKKTS